jgi:hypothetical protein
MNIAFLASTGLKWGIVIVGVLAATGNAATTSQPVDQKPLQIGSRKQLFVDDFVVAKLDGVTRELGKVLKANGGKPVMVPDKPWEDDAFGCPATVMHDGKKFRMWYRPWGEVSIAYAESKDGLHWEKPNLGLTDFKPEEAEKHGFRSMRGAGYSGKDNNLVPLLGHGFTCFYDAHEKDPEHRYKAAYAPHGQDKAGIAHSPDGFHWTPYNNGEPVTERAADTTNQLLWDDDAKVYRLFTRTDFGEGGGPGELRGTRSMTNPDIKADPTNWKTVRSWKLDREGADEGKRRQIYSLNDWMYEGVHFGLALIYEWPGDVSEGPHDLVKRHDRDICNFYIAPSRDLQDWDLTWIYAGQPMIPRGGDGSFDKDLLVPTWNIVTHEGEHWIYYGGYRERHDRYPREPGIGLAKLRLDGFVGLTAGEKEGMVITKPLVISGKALELNIDAKEGEASVAVLDADGKNIKGFGKEDSKPLKRVDGVAVRPEWHEQRDLSGLKGRAVRFQFHLKNARLYAFQIR